MSNQKESKKKHIYFLCDEKDKQGIAVAEQIKSELSDMRMRIYCPRKNEDVNTTIAQGIDNACVVLVFSSPSLESSKNGSKILNYADQTKTPIINIKLLNGFQAKKWLGAILAAARTCSTKIEDILKTFELIGVNGLTLEENETNKPFEFETPFFSGGTKLGNMSAFYYQDDEHPMEFEFFELCNGKIYGQGDDDVGSFTVAGFYSIENSKGVIKMEKKYVGLHTVSYVGNIVLNTAVHELTGYWIIEDYDETYTGKFSIFLYPDQMNQNVINNIETDCKKKENKIMLSFSKEQENLAYFVSKKLFDNGIQTIFETQDMHEMIKLAAKEATVVIPFMSSSYEASNDLKQYLSYVDQIEIPIIPVKAEPFPYTQSGWLGVICAGALYTEICTFKEVDSKIKDLIAQIQPHLKVDEVDYTNGNFCNVSGKATGYYIQYEEKFDMTFDMLALINGRIAGQGDDDIGSFVIHGEYCDMDLLTKNESLFTFKKHYIGMHDVDYSGIVTQTKISLSLDGNWIIDDLNDSFHIEISRTQTLVPRGLHVMLSYQWNNQELVKRVANILKERNIPVWFDIAGDMKGNINAAMANGVENSALILSFNTTAYSKSVNCQKELTYATQLNKPILPILLEDFSYFKESWLGQIISSLNKIDLKNTEQFEMNVETLVKSIDEIAIKKSIDSVELMQELEVKTIFEGGTVNGYYYQDNESYSMSFEFFRLSKGNVSGQGSDVVGNFTMAGKYNNKGKVSFKKQYIGQHYVEYTGIIVEHENGFEINGTWNIENCMMDKFVLKSFTF
ncbi:uncharacterized protein LOC136079653 [Hydra vulgaris]|uniref:Uncharacterized protein LOC136079653 n=1 Tax=Hydra vulgaris TaxID=6087 RepID=A0ABM4BRV6_HYDVU